MEKAIIVFYVVGAWKIVSIDPLSLICLLENDNFSSVEIESETGIQGTFYADDTDEAPAAVTFQLKRKYVVSTIKSGMLVVNQNRAHERVLYESYLQSITIEEAVSQQLLFPLKLSFSTLEVALLQGMKEQLKNLGFNFSKLDHDEVELMGIPVSVAEGSASDVLERLINDIEHQVPDSHFSQSDLIAKSMAKSVAIKAGQKLTTEEQEHLVNSLFACKEPNTTPSNKQTFITLTNEDLDKKFK